MKNCADHKAQFRYGELYLFHASNPCCPSSSSLWGTYEKTSNGQIYLEHSTKNLYLFKLHEKLPEQYHFQRIATRSELRDYMYNLGAWEAVAHKKR